MEIKYIVNKDIDKVKWDQCIKASFNGLIFSFSWYLDIVCDDWDALIEGDYTRVMPLPFIKKMNKLHIVIPPFVKQLGIFSIDKLTTEITDSFIESIPVKFKDIEISLNNMNKTTHTNFTYKQIRNYQIDLIQTYESMYDNFEIETKKTIEASSKTISIQKKIDPEDYIKFLKNINTRKIKLNDFEELKLCSLIRTLCKYNLGEVWGAFDSKNKLCGAAFFLMYFNRLSLLTIHKSSKTSNMSSDYLIINEFIKENASKSITLDLFQNAKDKELILNRGFGCIETISIELISNKHSFFYNIIK